jgi:hypothetical protein
MPLADQARVPLPDPIVSFAPTTVNSLAACPYRVALIRAGIVRTRPSLAAALGQVAHEMHQFYWRGGLADHAEEAVEPALRAEWDRLVATKQHLLDGVYGDGKPPRAVDWPGYALTRSRTIRSLRRLAEARPAEHGSGAIKSEIRLTDAVTGLYGTLDRLQVSDGKLTIVDLKSGVWQGEVTAQQRRQLLLYAWLVHASRGTWPTQIIVETAAGIQTVVEVVPEDVEQQVAEAQELVTEFNAAVDAGWAALLESASPDDETCRGCVARVVCGPYWAALSPEWTYQGAVYGRVTKITPTPEGTTITIDTVWPRGRLGQPTAVYQVSADPFGLDDVVAVVGADERGGPSVLRCRWDTQVVLVHSVDPSERRIEA